MSEEQTYEELALKLAEMQATLDNAGFAVGMVVLGVIVICVLLAILAFINNMYAH